MKISLVFFVISFFVTYSESARSTSPDCNFENPKSRIDGGWPAITQLQCENLYNCFDDTIPDVHYCFRPNKGRSTNPKCDFSNPKNRKDGGWNGISKLECESFGYCFDDTIPDVVFCILSPHKLANFNCDFTMPQQRCDVGYPFISRRSCFYREGCFDDTVLHMNYCFKRNKGRTISPICDFSNPSERINGGAKGIKKDVCESLGNCFDDTIPDVPWCFVPKKL